MTEWINNLISNLREELQQYGEMLARLDEQQEWIARRQPNELLASVSAVEEQVQHVQMARKNREVSTGHLLEALELPDETAMPRLIAQLPPEYGPLLEALVNENAELLLRIQHRTRQNHLLLSHSLQTMQKLMKSLFPNRPSLVYTDNGLILSKMSGRTLYEAVG